MHELKRITSTSDPRRLQATRQHELLPNQDSPSLSSSFLNRQLIAEAWGGVVNRTPQRDMEMRCILKVGWNHWASPEDQGSGDIEKQLSQSVDRKLPRNTAYNAFRTLELRVFPTSLGNVWSIP